jgi:DNA-binding Lrp family transcriptional regulator
VDIRLLSAVAESGKAAVHEIAARLGMDPREVASRLVALSAVGLPLIVGVECDPYALRNAIAGAMNYAAQNQQQYAPPRYGPPSGPAGPYPGQARAPAAPQRPGTQSVPFPAQDPMSTWGPPQSSQWARGDQPTRPANWTTPSATPAAQPAPASAPASGSTAGPVPVAAPVEKRGRVGETLIAEAQDGEQMAIQLVEVVDPADFLFTAAGYRLREGERSVVVHTELTNRGAQPFPQLPDLYLVLVAKDGQTVSKAPVSLSSRPPHRIGVRPGETAGGHTVYVLPETTEITSVRWTVRPDDERSLTWTIEP